MTFTPRLGLYVASSALGIAGYALLDDGLLHDMIVGGLFTTAGGILWHATNGETR